jgi:hypothetical protein
MKRIIALILILNSFSPTLFCQNIDREQKLRIIDYFMTDWEYFRMKANPMLTYEQTHDEWGRWKPPFLIPDSFYLKRYNSVLTISQWGAPKGVLVIPPSKMNQYVRMGFHSNLFLVEKRNGLLGVRKDYNTGKLDTLSLNIYDSIFPYDNRFLASYIGNNKYTFQSGNTLWGDWKDVGMMRRVDFIGYVRGVQFNVENVRYYSSEFSEKIKKFRPNYPNYEYTDAQSSSLLSHSWLLIGAPVGKEDQLVEFIYYSNFPEKTGDHDTSHFYEMRYILPTQITSIKERHLEKRLLTKEEKNFLLDKENGLRRYIEIYSPLEEELFSR